MTLLGHAVVYEDAEDGQITPWLIYDRDPSGATINNVFDQDEGSKVIEFQGAGQDNSYLIGHLYSTVSRAWNNTTNQIIKWDMRYDEPYTFYVRVNTQQGYRYIFYTADDTNRGRIGSIYIHYGLGSDTMNGEWQTIERNLETDLQTYEPTNSLVSVEGLMVRGSGRIDNLQMNTANYVNQNPVANAGSDQTVSLGNSVTIIGSGTDEGAVVSYQWTNEAGVVLANSATFSYTPAQAGTETLTLTVTDDQGAVGSDSVTVTATADTRILDRLNATIYEDAEDRKTFGWIIKDNEPLGATIKNEFDPARGSRVITLNGDGLNNAYYLQTPIGEYPWHQTEKTVIEWQMKTSEIYKVYVKINTNTGVRFLLYTPDNQSQGVQERYVHYGLGSSSQDGQWHTYIRDIEKDLQRFLPEETLVSIEGFMIRGNCSVDDILLMRYTLVQEDKTAPLIHLQGESLVTLEVGESYQEAGAVASDNSDASSALTANIVIDASEVNENQAGQYRVKYSLSDSAGNMAKDVYRTVVVREDKNNIGQREFFATPKKYGTIFVSPTGSGTACTESQPCHFKQFSADLEDRIVIQPGDVVFFREGIYQFEIGEMETFSLTGGTKSLPVIYESYPGERVIFDGSKISTKDTPNDEWRRGVIQFTGEYASLRNVEIRNMSMYGVRLYGNHNRVEHCKIYNNHLSGVEITNANFQSVDDSRGSYNIITDNRIFFNSDAGLDHHNYNKGDNADGVTIHSGSGNIVEHNEVFGNSDDGIDTWYSVDSKVRYNKVYDNGRASGNGNGIKLGGAPVENPLGANSVASYNLVYFNTVDGFSINSGKNVVMENNTAYRNYRYGYSSIATTTLRNNISWDNALGDVGWDNNAQIEVGNSWQLGGDFEPIELNPYLANYLKPKSGSDFDGIGAYMQQ